MIRSKVPAVLKFPLPFDWLKQDGKTIAGVMFSGVCVANACRDRIYSQIQILCTSEDAYQIMLQYSGRRQFQPYTNVSSFKLTVDVAVIHTTTPLMFNAMDVCRVVATPTIVMAESEELLTKMSAVLISKDNLVARDILDLHDAGIDMKPVVNALISGGLT